MTDSDTFALMLVLNMEATEYLKAHAYLATSEPETALENIIEAGYVSRDEDGMLGITDYGTLRAALTLTEWDRL